MKALLKKVLCGIVFLSATTATARIVVPLHELQGRTCYGHLYITDKTVNFDDSANDCRGMRYTKVEKIPTADERVTSAPDISQK